MEEESWRRPRTPLPLPPWRPCRPAHPHPPAHPPFLVIPATSPAGRSCKVCWETLGWACGYRDRKVTEYLQQLMNAATAKSPVRLSSSKALNNYLLIVGMSAKSLQWSRAVGAEGFFLSGGRNSCCWQRHDRLSVNMADGFQYHIQNPKTISPQVSFIILPANMWCRMEARPVVYPSKCFII